MSRDAAIQYVGLIGRSMPEACLAEIADSAGICPMGLIKEWTLRAMRIEKDVAMTHAPPIAGGAMQQPPRLMSALRTIAERRAINQRRDIPQKKDSPLVLPKHS